MTRVSIGDGLFTDTAAGPRLLGGRCDSCGTVTFPPQSGCPRCFTDEMEPIELSDHGTLWTFTTQGFPPKAAPEGAYIGPLDPFEPYAVGYVELEGHCKVEARLTEPDPSKLRVGQRMRLVLVPIANDDGGREIVTFAFEPVTS